MVRQLPSGRWQAVHPGPDGVKRTAGVTFETKLDATAWLDGQNADVAAGLWMAPTSGADRRQTLRTYSRRWLRERDLRPRTRDLYTGVLDKWILPDLGDVPLERIKPATVQTWFASLPSDKPTVRAHAYGLLRTVLGSAYAEDLIPSNPCRIRGGSAVKRQHTPKPATLAELEVIAREMPDRYRLMVLFAAWLGLRFGELVALERRDVDLEAQVVRVRRGAVRVAGEVIVGEPKTAAGVRSVAIPPHLLAAVREHLEDHVDPGAEALLFPARGGGYMRPSTLYRVFYRAREKAGREDLRWHDLRHTGAVLAAVAGATLADLMARLGHTTPQAAMVYQHAAADRDAVVAEALSDIASGDFAKPIPLRRQDAATR
jgi:integrase